MSPRGLQFARIRSWGFFPSAFLIMISICSPSSFAVILRKKVYLVLWVIILFYFSPILLLATDLIQKLYCTQIKFARILSVFRKEKLLNHVVYFLGQ